MKNNILCLLPVLAITSFWSPTAHAAKEPLRLRPESKWVMRYQDDSCRLVRLFGKDDDKMMIVLTRFGPGSKFRMTLAGKPVKIHSAQRPLKVQFGAHEQEQRIPYLMGEAGGLPALIAIKQVKINGAAKKAKADPLNRERYAAAEFIKVRVGQKKQVLLETGSLAKPFGAMNKCVRKLMTSWGIDVDRHKERTQSVRPLGSPEDWVKSEDYPTDMLREKQPALVNFRLSVDENGKPASCHIQQTTRPQEFDDAVCGTLMKRATFSPALDADGKPMASYWRNMVRFAINH